VADRIAQTVARLYLEPKVEPLFHPDSYGYRPGRSALDAVGACRERCWRRDWVIDLDIRAFFDSVPHELVLRAVRRHTDERWILLYVERWLKAPLLQEDGTLARDRGTPRSSISPLLANLFLHIVRHGWEAVPEPQFERYCDDLYHRKASGEPLRSGPHCDGWRSVVWRCIQTKSIVYCKDEHRRATYANERSTSWGTRFVLAFRK
jgi:RNA-directed DNA polymerase